MPDSVITRRVKSKEDLMKMFLTGTYKANSMGFENTNPGRVGFDTKMFGCCGKDLIMRPNTREYRLYDYENEDKWCSWRWLEEWLEPDVVKLKLYDVEE